MALRPFSANLQKAFRDTLETPGSPEVIDDSQPVMPVAVVAQVNTASSSSFTRVTDGTDTLAVNTDGGINVNSFLPSNATLRIITGTGTGATQNIATVTVGKTAYLMGYYTGHTAAGSFIGIMDGSGNVNFYHYYAANGSATVAAPYPIVSWASGGNIQVTVTNTVRFSLTVLEV